MAEQFDFTLSTNRINRNNVHFFTPGIRFDNFRNNPILLFNHAYYNMPIGHVPEISLNDDSHLVITIEIPDTEAGMPFIEAIRSRRLNGVSGRFLPISPPGTEIRTIETRSYLYVPSSDLLEVSLATLPADPGAVLRTRPSSATLQAAPDDARTPVSTLLKEWLDEAK